MNKRHYEHTLPNIRGSLSNTYFTSSAIILHLWVGSLVSVSAFQHFHREVGISRILFRVVIRLVLSISGQPVFLLRISVVLRYVFLKACYRLRWLWSRMLPVCARLRILPSLSGVRLRVVWLLPGIRSRLLYRLSRRYRLSDRLLSLACRMRLLWNVSRSRSLYRTGLRYLLRRLL